ncbi:MAG TPA: Na+/H+ antiporter NhaA [Candidatus Avipropionibacterium avicola]|uniref:Na(+)/H(+) antiporter NhaA n=1 Tax=Candidatus Avipropionibacterium avicola TaxID=2840701 RepID=A0A9D1H0B8_9ACTN|nr:Na+/H+ antiporter NhaA [Candidatus Avipropionibacterium avicola]
MEKKRTRRTLVAFGPSDNQDQVAVADLLRNETVGGAVMLAAMVAALVWANISFEGYDAVRQIRVGPLDLQHWAADGLLTIFFFLAGLELKREFRSGSLSNPRQALLPIVAAFCGMAVPALIYVGINLTSPDANLAGWAVPMATDIAFAVAVLAVVAPGLPPSLRTFLLTLAIVDDLGAIVVIAIVFTSTLNWLALALAAACAGVWFFLQQRRLDKWWLHVPLFVGCWWFMHESGVHATIAGVLLGLLTRTSPYEDRDPVDRWSHFWAPVSAGFAVPVFALASAGVRLDPASLRSVLTHPVTLGISVGLVVGKTIGVFGGTWLTARITRTQLHGGVLWREIAAVGLLAGIGFTVALLVTELAFTGHPDDIDHAKAAVLLGSATAAVLATIFLRICVALRRRSAAAPTT